MNKKYLHHLWAHRVKPVRPWYLIATFLLVAGGTVFALRQNNLGMIDRRAAVYRADQNNQDVEGALRRLRQYVYAHMNTEVASGQSPIYPPIQLKYTYQRLVAAEEARVSDVNSKVYSDAQTTCEQEYPNSFSGGPRVPCIQQYVTDHGTQIQKIPDSLYKFDFISPRWSPDLAGWLLLVSAVLGVAAVLRILAGLLARQFLD